MWFPRIIQLTIAVLGNLYICTLAALQPSSYNHKASKPAATRHWESRIRGPALCGLTFSPTRPPPPIELTPLPIQSFPQSIRRSPRHRRLSHPARHLPLTHAAFEPPVDFSTTNLLFPRSDPIGQTPVLPPLRCIRRCSAPPEVTVRAKKEGRAITVSLTNHCRSHHG